MTREEKLSKIESLKIKANKLKKEADYYNLLPIQKSERSERSEKTGRISDIEIGDIVYKNISGEILGEVIEIVPNHRHPRKVMSCRIKEREYQSLYNLDSVHKR